MSDITIPDPLPPAVLDREGFARATEGDAERYRTIAERYGPLADLYPREPEPEMVTATYPGDTWERMREVAAMEGATGRWEWKDVVTTGPASTSSTDCITLGDDFGFYRSASGGTLTVTAPKPPEPERPEWADALVIHAGDVVRARHAADNRWYAIGNVPGDPLDTMGIIESGSPVTVLVDADGEVMA